MGSKDDKNDMLEGLKYIGVPFTIIIAPIFGYFVGNWLDQFLGTSPYLTIVFLFIGLASAIREIYKLIKKINENDK